MSLPPTRTRTLLACAVLVLAGLTPSHLIAQSANPGPGATADESWVLLRVSGMIRAGVKISTIRNQLDGVFRAADIDGDGITKSDRTIAQQISEANRRATMITRWARWDLNGDGRVTREEIATAHSQQIANAFRVNNFIVEPSEAQRKELQDKIVAEAMEMDADGDGVLSLDDILQTSKKSDKTNKRPITTYSGATLPEAFDHNGDGTISLEEFRSVVDRVLARLDSDKDGTISASEIDAFRADIDAARRARQRSIPL